ncbi:MAG TPA: hypothetical protein VMH86_09120 [Rhizomicrobium sp.]|nr:hypothetical protein [Rhizomicrobium sp.]
MSTPLPPPANDPHARWRFLRDVLVFQLKLVLGNLQNFLLLPVTLVAAAMDLVLKGRHEGERFYWVLEWGRRTDEAINIYGAIGGYHATGGSGEGGAMKSRYTVDTVLARLEGVIVREYEKGGTAASVKAAVDKAIDDMQARTGDAGERASEALRAAAEKIKEKMEK